MKTNIDDAYKILEEFDSIAKKMDIDYFFLFGTSLEMYRDKGFIDSTRDVDIGIRFEDNIPIRKMLRELHNLDYTLRKKLPPRYNLRKNINIGNMMSFYSFNKYSIPLDIYLCILDDKNNNYVVGRKYIIPKENLETLGSITINNKKYNIPKDIESYLDYSYKDWRNKHPEVGGPLH